PGGFLLAFPSSASLALWRKMGGNRLQRTIRLLLSSNRYNYLINYL
ncbi:hypothetical protein SSYM_1102, partial [Serratia symbiotica str. Tucson]